MTLLQLEYFQEIAREKSISVAAKKLGVSPSTLSITMNRLEDELGYSLFEHCGKNILLTPYGKEVLSYSYVILHVIEDIELDFKEKHGIENKGKISIGITDSNYYGDWILELLDQHPDLKLNMIQMSREEIYNNLLLGNLDFGISNKLEYPEQLNFKLLFSQPYQLLVFQDHPLASKGMITLDELAKEPLISLPPSHKNRMIDSLCQEVCLHPNIIFEGDSDIMCEMFHFNIGSILTCAHNSRQWMKFSDDNYSMLNIEGVTSRYEMYLIWPKYRYLSKQARVFKDYVFDYYHI